MAVAALWGAMRIRDRCLRMRMMMMGIRSHLHLLRMMRSGSHLRIGMVGIWSCLSLKAGGGTWHELDRSTCSVFFSVCVCDTGWKRGDGMAFAFLMLLLF